VRRFGPARGSFQEDSQQLKRQRKKQKINENRS